MLDRLAPPAFVRAATPEERDIAGASQRRVEASLHNLWLHLANRESVNWWDDLVPEAFRRLASRRRRGQAGNVPPEEKLRRMAFEDFTALFAQTFPGECDRILGSTARRREYMLELLLTARDAAGHPGRPYSTAEARLVAVVAWEMLHQIPLDHHDSPDQLAWLRDQMLDDGEGWLDESFDVSDEPLPAECWADLYTLCASFRPAPGGDGGFASAVTDVLGRYHANVFMQAGELTMGTGAPALSGLFHENDLGVTAGGVRLILELKLRRRGRVNKSDLMIFNQKVLDFQLALIRSGERARVLRAFVTNDGRITDVLRGYCLQWGIILIEPELKPIPVLLSGLRELADEPGMPVGFEAALARAERLAANLRPMDRILIPSTLSRWRRLLDAGRFPTGEALRELVRDHHHVHEYAQAVRMAFASGN